MARIAMRDAYGQALAELGGEMENIVALDADISGSSKSGIFGAKYPDRFYNVGICEANMAGMAAGMAMKGKIPFAHCFAAFMMLRAGDPVRSLICYQELPVKLCGTYAGLSDSYDGASHHSISDLSFFRALPNLTVISPADPTETRLAVRAAAKTPGPVYLRILRSEVEDVFDSSYQFEIGKAVEVAGGGDVTIMATGYMLSKALKAAEELKREGIGARVVNVHTIKPIDADMIIKCAKETAGIVTVEEHNIHGGLGSAVAEIAARHAPCPMEMVGIRDMFAESGDYEKMLEKYGLSSRNIVEKVRALLARRK